MTSPGNEVSVLFCLVWRLLSGASLPELPGYRHLNYVEQKSEHLCLSIPENAWHYCDWLIFRDLPTQKPITVLTDYAEAVCSTLGPGVMSVFQNHVNPKVEIRLAGNEEGKNGY